MSARHSYLTVLCRTVLAALLFIALGCSEDAGLKVQRLSKDKGGPGDHLVIHGAGFQNGGARRVRVFFDNYKAKVIKFIGDEEIRVEVPGGPEMGKTVDVQLVFEPGGATKLSRAFRYVEIAGLKVDDFEKKKVG